MQYQICRNALNIWNPEESIKVFNVFKLVVAPYPPEIGMLVCKDLITLKMASFKNLCYLTSQFGEL